MEKKITATLLKELRPKMTDAVTHIANEYGLNIRFGNATFDENAATMKVEITFAATDDYDPAKANWDKHCKMFSGFEPEDFGKVFQFPGSTEEYRIAGYNSKGKTNRVIIVRVRDGKEFVAPDMEVRIAIGKATAKKNDDSASAATGTATDPAKMQWDLKCWRWGMKPEDFGKETMVAGKKFMIVGCKPNARKNCVLIRNMQTGTEYVTTGEEAKAGLINT